MGKAHPRGSEALKKKEKRFAALFLPRFAFLAAHLSSLRSHARRFYAPLLVALRFPRLGRFFLTSHSLPGVPCGGSFSGFAAAVGCAIRWVLEVRSSLQGWSFGFSEFVGYVGEVSKSSLEFRVLEVHGLVCGVLVRGCGRHLRERKKGREKLGRSRIR